MGLGAGFLNSHFVDSGAWDVFGFLELCSEELMSLKFAAEEG